ncbi:uncharacterized protein Bfra_006756 [Botrytis fragariae]|uniref:Uncharacterized protein n=1 Tax=Botrytis fragariae TaxID=1964551 RepID=A0A8H6B5X3_9HELO|nr:uncharacterized protein Bfra_006756 [Botrytis fragariae]KAF5879547.1 hypothetical protein Bfra_006756 [Botrytis fragariae]
MTVTQVNRSNRKASVRFSAITFEDPELDLQLDSLTSISNTGDEDNLHGNSFYLNLPRLSLQGSNDDSASEHQSKHLIPSPASCTTKDTLLVNNPSFTHPYTDTTLKPVANLNKLSWNIDWQQPTLIISMLLIGLLFYSSWATPTFKDYTNFSWPSVYTEPDGTPTNSPSDDSYLFSSKHILLQTSTSSIVYSQINASFEVTIASITWCYPAQKSSLNHMDRTMHHSQFVALASTLAGNATLTVKGWVLPVLSNRGNDLWSFIAGQCNIIALGLLACEEFQKSPFVSKMSTPDETNAGTKNLYATCPTQSYQCRNQSILRAIEDLSKNITISYLILSSESLRPQILRSYTYIDPFLFLSYGIGFLFTSIATIIGLHSIHLSGVSYSILFSTILATTRNTDLDALNSGASLGADPLAKNIKQTRFKFGPVLGKQGMGQTTVTGSGVPYVAFGLEGTVGDLKEWGQYV